MNRMYIDADSQKRFCSSKLSKVSYKELQIHLQPPIRVPRRKANPSYQKLQIPRSLCPFRNRLLQGQCIHIRTYANEQLVKDSWHAKIVINMHRIQKHSIKISEGALHTNK
jgi:hypothetical protein